MTIIITNDKANVYTEYNSTFVKRIKKVESARWNAGLKCWTINTSDVDVVVNIIKEVYNVDEVEVKTETKVRTYDDTTFTLDYVSYDMIRFSGIAFDGKAQRICFEIPAGIEMGKMRKDVDFKANQITKEKIKRSEQHNKIEELKKEYNEKIDNMIAATLEDVKRIHDECIASDNQILTDDDMLNYISKRVVDSVTSLVKVR